MEVPGLEVPSELQLRATPGPGHICDLMLQLVAMMDHGSNMYLMDTTPGS